MKPHRLSIFIFVFLAAIAPVCGRMLAAQTAHLRVGVAKTDSTPTDLTGLTTQWRKQFTRVHDPIFVRALVMENGATTAAIVTVDLIEFGDTLPLRERVARETGIASDHLMITASHAHAAPRARLDTAGGNQQEGGSAVAAYTARLYDQVVSTVKQARAALQPARVGIGTGTADVNISRDEYTGKEWVLGINPDGPSNKTVWVVKFESPAGEPIALFFNYAVHSVVAGPDNDQLTGDLAGAAERYVEQHYKNKAVALFAMSAAGDQNPKFIGPGQAEQEAVSTFDAIAAQGLMLGAEVVRVANHIEKMTDAVQLTASQRMLSCPGAPRKARNDGSAQHAAQDDPHQGPGARTEGGQKDAGREPQEERKAGAQAPQPAAMANINLSLIRLNEIVFTGVSAEIVTNIYSHLLKDSPLKNTMLLSMANGRNGYIVDDASFDKPIFEVNAASVARGCAENGIVTNLVEMIDATAKAGQ